MTERKRASLFASDAQEEGVKLELGKFQPKKAPEAPKHVVEKISEESGFTTTHAPKPAPKRDGRRLKRSARTAQFNVRLKPENAERFWAGAESEGFEYADDFLQFLLDSYEKGRGKA